MTPTTLDRIRAAEQRDPLQVRRGCRTLTEENDPSVLELALGRPRPTQLDLLMAAREWCAADLATGTRWR